jgi:hypothetical protein
MSSYIGLSDFHIRVLNEFIIFIRKHSVLQTVKKKK